MPISEDEVDHKPSHPSGLSKAEQRRSNKPIMEKRRRARINHCLNELKALILDAMKKDPARHSKLEKADILEMTVKHLQNVQRQQLAIAVATDPTVLQKFKTGFNECAGEVSRYISRIEGVDPGVRQRLLSHLSSCVSGLQQLTPFSFSAMAAPGLGGFPLTNPLHIPVGSNTGGLPSVLPQVPFPAGDVNNNHARLMSGLQLIPSRLPTGELALLVPGSGQLPGVLPFFPPPVQSSVTSSSSSSSASSAAVPPSATVTSGAIGADRSHPSAFAPVTRNASPPPPTIRPRSPQRRPQSPLSPVSTSSGASLTSESYQSPSTPTATVLPQTGSTQNIQQPQSHLTHEPTMTSYGTGSSVGVPGAEPRFKIPLGSPSTCGSFKTFHLPENLRNTGQQQPTSINTFTSDMGGASSEVTTTTISGPTTSHEIQHSSGISDSSEFKSDNVILVSSASCVPDSTTMNTSTTSTATHTVISVPSYTITTPITVDPELSCDTSKDPPLDFSMKKDKELQHQVYPSSHIPSMVEVRMSPKRPLNNPNFEDKGPPAKEPRLSIPFATDSRTGDISKAWNFSGNPKVVKVEPMSRTEKQLKMDDYSKPSTSSNKDMWRPW